MADAIGADLSAGIDGISFLPELIGQGEQQEHEYLYWEFHELGGRQAVRCGDWKAVVNNISAGRNVELYNLTDDPSETADLSEQFPQKTAYMDSLMRVSHTPSESFPFPGD
jgi:arylsulfatase A-like enzyme